MIPAMERVEKGEPQTVAQDAEKCCCSWTGGKDCNLALLKAWRDPSLNVIGLVVFLPEGKAFDAHPVSLMEAQAEALRLTLHQSPLPSSLSFRDSYVQAIQQLHNDHGIQVIITGDMDLVGKSPTNWMDECCRDAGIRAFHPLWKADRAECLQTLMAERFHVLFSCVKQPWFDASWCGRKLDENSFQEMVVLSQTTPTISANTAELSTLHGRDPRRLPLDLGGEQGEYHTMCLDGPIYTHPIHLELGDPKESGSERAKEEDPPRWWTYDGQRWWTLGDWKVRQKTSNSTVASGMQR